VGRAKHSAPVVTKTDAGADADADGCVDVGDGGVLDAKTARLIAVRSLRVASATAMARLEMRRPRRALSWR
jgi:hypothetical protein